LASAAHHSRQLAVELEVSELLCLWGIDEFAKEDIVQSNCAFSPGATQIAAGASFCNDVGEGRHHAAGPDVMTPGASSAGSSSSANVCCNR
jgi:hypothetical protein